MPLYDIELKDGSTVTVEADREPTVDEALSFLKSQKPEAPAEPKTSAAGAFAARAATGVLPALAGVGGWAAGASLAPETGGLSFAIPLGASVLSTVLGSKIQKAALPKGVEEYLAKSGEEHPIAAPLGDIAGAAATFEVSPGQGLRGLAAIPKVIRGTASAAERRLAASAATQAGIGAGLGVVQPAIEGERPTLAGVAESAALPLLLGHPRGYVQKGLSALAPGRAAAPVQPPTPPAPGATPDARSIQEAAALHGNVRPQPPPTGPLPVQEGGPGVQPQAPQGLSQEESQRVLLGSGQLAAEIEPEEAAAFEASRKAEVEASQMPDVELNKSLKVVRETLRELEATGQEVPQEIAEQLKVLINERRKRVAAWQQPQDIAGADVDALERQAIDAGEKLGQNFEQLKPEGAQPDLGAGEQPFGGPREIMRALGGNRIAMNRAELLSYARSLPPNKVQPAIQAMVEEEALHNEVINTLGDQGALGYWNDLTSLEKAFERRIYYGEWNPAQKVSDTNMGHESIRRRLQLARNLEPREFIETAGREYWTVRSLDLLGRAVRSARESLGTKASERQLAMFERMLNNVAIASAVANGKDAFPVQGGHVEYPLAIRRKILFHGSKREFDEFEIGHYTGEQGTSEGVGIYLAEHPSESEGYRYQIDPDTGYPATDKYGKPIMGPLYSVQFDFDPEGVMYWERPLADQTSKVRNVLKEMMADAKKRNPKLDLNTLATAKDIYSAYSPNEWAYSSAYLDSKGVHASKYDSELWEWESQGVRDPTLIHSGELRQRLSRLAPDASQEELNTISQVGSFSDTEQWLAAMDHFLNKHGVFNVNAYELVPFEKPDRTYNWVVFNPKRLKIINREGKEVPMDEARQQFLKERAAERATPKLPGFEGPAARRRKQLEDAWEERGKAHDAMLDHEKTLFRLIGNENVPEAEHEYLFEKGFAKGPLRDYLEKPGGVKEFTERLVSGFGVDRSKAKDWVDQYQKLISDFDLAVEKTYGEPPSAFPAARRRKQLESQYQQKMPLFSELKTQYTPESEFRGQQPAPMKAPEAGPVEHPAQQQFAETYQYPEATTQALQGEAGDYFKNVTRPAYQDFSAKMSAQFGPKLEGWQVAEIFDDTMKKAVHGASGNTLKRWLEETGLSDRFVRGKDRRKAFAELYIPDSPRETGELPGMAAKADLNTRLRAQGALMDLFSREMARPMTRGSLDRTDISPTDLAWDKFSPSNVWAAVPPEVGKDAAALTDLIKRKGEGRIYGENVSVTRRLVALKNDKTGAVHLVSAYMDPRRGLVVRDPERIAAAGIDVQEALRNHTATYTGMAADPVRNFKKTFMDAKEFMSQFGQQALDRSSQESEAAGYVPMHVAGEGAGLEAGIEAVAAPEQGARPLTEAESGALYDSLTEQRADLRTPDQVRQHIARLSQIAEENRIIGERISKATKTAEQAAGWLRKARFKTGVSPEEAATREATLAKANEAQAALEQARRPFRQVLSAYKKIYDSIRDQNPGMDPGDALKKLYEEVQQAYSGTNERAGFVREITRRHGPIDIEGVPRPGGPKPAARPGGARELTYEPRKTPIPAGGIPPSPRIARREVSASRWAELHPPTGRIESPVPMPGTPEYFPTTARYPEIPLAPNVPGRPAPPPRGGAAWRGAPFDPELRAAQSQMEHGGLFMRTRPKLDPAELEAVAKRAEAQRAIWRAKGRPIAGQEQALGAIGEVAEAGARRPERPAPPRQPLRKVAPSEKATQPELPKGQGRPMLELPKKPPSAQQELFGPGPAAIIRSRKQLAEEWENVKATVRAWSARRELKNEEIWAARDRVDNLAAYRSVTEREGVITASLGKRAPGEKAPTRAQREEARKRREAAPAAIATSELQWLSVLRGAGIKRAPFLIPNRANLVDLLARVDRGIANARQLMTKADLRDARIGRKWLEGATRLRQGIEYAQAHWHEPEFRATVQAVRDAMKAQYYFEKQHGTNLNQKFAYYPHRYELEFWNDHSTIFGSHYMGGAYWKAQPFKSHYHAIEDQPYLPKNYDAADLVGHRVLQGSRSVNKKIWRERLFKLVDPDSGKPVAKPAGRDKAGRLSTEDPEYELVPLDRGRNTIAVRRAFAKTIEAAGGGGGLADVPVMGEALKFAQFLKHNGILIYDTFHPARLIQYALALSGKPTGWKAGYALSNFKEADLPKAVAAGLVERESAAWAQGSVNVNFGGQQVPMSRHQLLMMALDEKLNLGRMQDALFAGTFHHLFPGARWLNRKVFDQITRGLMTRNAIDKFEQYNAKRPDIPVRQLMRDVVKDVNVFYGNLGRQGVLGKNPVVRDLMQTVFLAPNWVEGLAAKEAKFLSRTTQLSRLMGRSGTDVPYMGTLGSAMAKGLGFYFGLTQALNLISRGQFTWQNREPDHKWDAWVGAGQQGFWMNPMAVFAELSHDILRLAETKPKVWDAIDQVGRNKLGPWGRMAAVMARQKTAAGEQITTTPGMIRESAEQLIPIPITVSKPLQALGHKLAPGVVSPTPPGSVQRQLLASLLGIKGQAADPAARQVQRLADRWLSHQGLRNEGVQLSITTEPSYGKMRSALRVGDNAVADKMLQALLKTHTLEQVTRSMETHARHPFTGKHDYEDFFISSLTDGQRGIYADAQQERMLELQLYYELLQNSNALR